MHCNQSKFNKKLITTKVLVKEHLMNALSSASIKISVIEPINKNNEHFLQCRRTTRAHTQLKVSQKNPQNSIKSTPKTQISASIKKVHFILYEDIISKAGQFFENLSVNSIDY